MAWSWAAVEADEEWRLYALSVRGATAVEDAMLGYPGVRIGTEAVGARTAAKRLRDGRLGPRGAWANDLGVPPVDRVSGDWCFSGESQHLAPRSWPQFYLNLSFGHSAPANRPPYAPLSAPRHPYYPTFEAALAERVFGLTPEHLQNYSTPLLIISLPDTRVRIGGLTADDGRVVVDVQSNGHDLSGLSLRAAWRDESRDPRWHHQGVKLERAGEVSIPTGGIPTEIVVAVVATSGRVLDQRGWNEQLGSRPEMRGDYRALVERWLAEGEGTWLEFKQDLKTPKVRQSFAETVAAFANGGGGRILVGVSDAAKVIGHQPDKAADLITDIVHSLVTEPPQVEIRHVVIDQQPIQVVEVPAGDAFRKPYRCGGKTMIRANGTTREATTFQIRALVMESQSARLR